MVSTYSDNLRLTKQGDGDNSNTWGQVVNAQVIELLEEALAGVTVVDVTGSSNVNIASSAQNGATDTARHMVLELTGTLGADIQLIVPSVQKMYLIRAAWTGAYTVDVRPSGGAEGVVFSTGDAGVIYTSGTDIYDVQGRGALLAANNLDDLDSAGTARTNLGLGSSAVLNVGTSANEVVQLDGDGKLPAVDGSNLTGLDSGGTIASQDADNVAITGGTIVGITDLAVADGGTGASTAADARTNLGLGTMATQDASAVAITGGTIAAGVAFTNVQNANGYIRLGNITLQWGTITTEGFDGIADGTFPVAFSATPYAFVITAKSSTDWATGTALNSSTFRINVAGSAGESGTFTWLAVGPT